MSGRLEKPENAQLKDLSLREMAVFLPIALLIVWIGVHPSPFLKLTAASSNYVLSQLQNSPVVERQAILRWVRRCPPTPKPLVSSALSS